MILKSFLAGFAAYVLAVIYNLLQGSSLKIVFINGIKFLFTVTLLTLVFQMIFYYLSSDSNSDAGTDEAEAGAENHKKNEAEESEIDADSKSETEFNSDEFSEDFSPFNPPEIEYEEQNK